MRPCARAHRGVRLCEASTHRASLETLDVSAIGQVVDLLSLSQNAIAGSATAGAMELASRRPQHKTNPDTLTLVYAGSG